MSRDAVARRLPPVLMYHHVEAARPEPPPLHPDSYLDRATFARHLDLFARSGLRTLTLAEALAAATAGRRPRRSVVLTFDDGCRCFAAHAFPELAARGMTATLFAVAGELGGSNRWDAGAGERVEALLDSRELRELAGRGIEIGSHGMLHRDLAAAAPEELAAEVGESKARLEAVLGRRVETFCYPYGRLDPVSRRAVAAAGYAGAVGIHGHPHATLHDRFAIARMIVRPNDSPFELRLKALGLYPAWSRLPRLGLLAALRRRRARSGPPR